MFLYTTQALLQQSSDAVFFSLENQIVELNKEKDILIKRYGLNSSKKMTQKEIAKEYHISRSYISRIEKRALIKLLKCYLQEKEG